jgi:hypothetical protein
VARSGSRAGNGGSPREPAASRTGSLVVVGTGVAAVGQVTLESVELMRQAERLLYLAVDPLTELWLSQLNPASESLAGLYGERRPRQQTYRAMTARMVGLVQDGVRVCAAFYGHPGVFVESTHRAIARLRRDGYEARMVPGVTADGCLYADLGVNPGDCGVQSWEATDFLLARRRFDPTSHLLLWQIGVLGESTARPGTCRPERLARLVARLRRHYRASHPIVLYQAGVLPGEPARVERLPLARLADAEVFPLAMLYVPPRPQRAGDPAIVRWYEESRRTPARQSRQKS